MAIPSPRGPSAPNAASRLAATRGDAQNRARETIEPRMPLGEAPTTSALRPSTRSTLGRPPQGRAGHFKVAAPDAGVLPRREDSDLLQEAARGSFANRIA